MKTKEKKSHMFFAQKYAKMMNDKKKDAIYQVEAVPFEDDDVEMGKMKRPKEVTDRKTLLEEILSLRSNVMVIGKAGTGKTHLINAVSKEADKRGITVLKVAPTGLAATHIGGFTIHKALGISSGSVRPYASKDIDEIIVHTDLIILDEVSMCRADLLDAVDLRMRRATKRDEAFGGKPMMICGDLLQLDPVVAKDDHFEKKGYVTPYAFSARSFKEGYFKTYCLTKNYRQDKDKKWLEILDRVREGIQDPNDIAAINSRIMSRDDERLEPVPRLFATNKLKNEYNETKLGNLDGVAMEYALKWKFNAPADDAVDFEEVGRTFFKGVLKVGARVMFTINDKNNAYKNGELGYVVAMEQGGILVTKDNGDDVVVPLYAKPITKVFWNDSSKHVEEEEVGAVEGLPVQLGWGMTVHKSQGLTFDKVTLDMASQFWASGQAYVALSRCRTLEGLSILGRFHSFSIKASKSALIFLKSKETKEIE